MGIQYRGYVIASHGRRFRIQLRPRPIVRDTIGAAKETLEDAAYRRRSRTR